MTASYDKLVIDNEIIGMVMRAVAGIDVNEETLAFDIIKKVGPGGNYLSERHTRKHMRSEQFLSELSNKDDRPSWEAGGSREIRARAAQKVTELLEKPPRSFIPDETFRQMRSSIPGLRKV